MRWSTVHKGPYEDTHSIGSGVPERLSEGRGNGVQMKMRAVWEQRWDRDYPRFK